MFRGDSPRFRGVSPRTHFARCAWDSVSHRRGQSRSVRVGKAGFLTRSVRVGNATNAKPQNGQGVELDAARCAWDSVNLDLKGASVGEPASRYDFARCARDADPCFRRRMAFWFARCRWEKLAFDPSPC